MNHLSKRIATGFASGGLLVATVLAVPASTFAIADSTVKETPFCTNISSSAAKITDGITAAKTKMNTARTDRANQFTSNRTKWDQEIQASRDKADQQRQENFAKLEAKATTDAKKWVTRIRDNLTALQAELDNGNLS